MNKENFGKKIREELANGKTEDDCLDLYVKAIQHYCNQITEALTPLPKSDVMFAVAALLNMLDGVEHSDNEGYVLGVKLKEIFPCKAIFEFDTQGEKEP